MKTGQIRNRKAKINQPLKFDSTKTQLELIPPELIWGAGRGLTHGAKKYAPGNWAKGDGFEWSRLYGALQRHLNEFWSGEDIDSDSGNHHLDHAACMLAFLMAHSYRGFGFDNRVEIGVKDASNPTDILEKRPHKIKSRGVQKARRRKDTKPKRKR